MINNTGIIRTTNDTGYGSIFDAIKANGNKEITAIRDALKVAKDQGLFIINPHIKDETELDNAWYTYNSYTKPFRRKADWITLQYFNLTNQQIYDYIKRDIYDKESVKGAVITDGNCGSVDDPLNFAESYYVPDSQRIDDIDQALYSIENIDGKMEMADQYMRDTGYILLVPSNIYDLDTLENYWDAYKTMVIRHQRMADWKTVELFGLTNEQIYIGLKKKFLADGQDFKNDENDPNKKFYTNESKLIEGYLTTTIKKKDMSNTELAKSLYNISRVPDFYEKTINKRIITHAIDQYEDINSNVPSNEWEYSDLPAYLPDEMIDMGIYSGGTDPESPIQPNDDMIFSCSIVAEEWFREYTTFIATGVCSDRYRSLNLERVRSLEKLYAQKDTTENEDLWESTVYRFGWNPKVQFTPSRRVVNDILMRNTLRETYMDHYDFINMTEEVDISDINTIREMDFSNSPFKPIFIILFTGKTAFSKAIKKVTDSIYSHAMISLDSSFTRCYSYGVEGAVGSLGGFIVENLYKKPKDSLCRIYTAFINKDAHETIQRNIDWFIQNQKKTMYGFKNIITYLFKIPFQSDTNMICSQFVDRMIKLGHIDFTKKASSLLSPEDINRAARKSKKIFTIFSDVVGKLSPKAIDRKIDIIYHKGKILESADFCMYRIDESDMIYQRLLHPIDEIKELPIRFNATGDIIVNAIKKIDYEAEFAKSHKLLVEYDKSNNIDGMKSELAHMWSYLLEIEEKLYGLKSNKTTDRTALFKVRAKIIGDFKKYMKVVMRTDHGFDFGKYFEESPYSNSSYKISKSTINGLLKAIKIILY